MKTKQMRKKKHNCSEQKDFTLSEFKEFLKNCEDSEPLQVIKPCGCVHKFTRQNFIDLIQNVEDLLSEFN